MPNSEGLLTERFDFNAGKESPELSAVTPDVAFLERAGSSVWPPESVTLDVPRKMMVYCHILKDEGQQWEHPPLGLSLTNSSCVPPACLLGSL